MFKPGDIKKNVLFGEDGWAFLWQGGQRQFDFLTGKSSASQSSVDNLVANLKGRTEFCAARNIPYLHVVFPSKPVTMTEYLPAEIRGQVQSLYERQYAGAIDAAMVESILYPRPTLLEEKASCPVFSRQDTHMTETGNAIVSREILRRLGHRHDPLSCMEAEERDRLGDLAIMAGTRKPLPERFLQTLQRTERIWDNRPFLPSNTDNVTIAHNPRSASRRRLLALGDSFLWTCLTPLSTFYRDILYVRSDLFQPELVDLFGPDDIVSANAERYLCKVRSDAEAESVVLGGYGRTNYHPSDSFVSALKAQLAYRPYLARYAEWASQVDAMCFDRIGAGEINNHLQFAKRDASRLTSTGQDPQIIFNNTPFKHDRRYQLKISMESDVESVAQLFESSEEGYPFVENRSQTHRVMGGPNIFTFDLMPARRGKLLRFDPLKREGNIRNLSMELIEAAA
ncbi:hypothetical protein MOK15_09580 [Sphingobium sp. BYY-5]|uniref:alginate O-acetyltransferase AlgX-related protein n=1 Tax=Sphingobium sp. BYY-5 TaxID=2926400 RepID=UPI001FA7E2D6|nr:hypothetical protein [Sphingobium sp. BYY-5]MCI4590344.1 hypothetical protein [Sphingobium sp. BYY-5]